MRVGMEASGHARWLNDCWPSRTLSCGLATQRRFKPSGYARQRRIGEDARLLLRLLLEIVFRGSGCRAGKIAIYGNCFGIGTDGAGGHAHHESIASGGPERRLALQEKVVAGKRTAATGVVPVGSLGIAGDDRICWRCWID